MVNDSYTAFIDGEVEEYPHVYQSLPMLVLQEQQFDQLLRLGWRFLGETMIRHSISIHYEQIVLTIPGRIRLSNFYLSKSQRKLLRLGERDLRIELEPKRVNASDEQLFAQHKARFDDNPPTQLSRMVAYNPQMPCTGHTLRVYAGEKHIATSFFHLSSTSADSSYCVYDTSSQWAKYSLGHLTMLIEILHCQQLGLEYYYVGYRYHVPSHFDYKANFYGLERLKEFREWVPCSRIPPKPLDQPLKQENTDE